MNADLAALLYLVASVCFILALRGLSHSTTSRAGNLYGMVGISIAILTTLATPGVVSYAPIIAAILIGGAHCTFIALRIKMRWAVRRVEKECATTRRSRWTRSH